MNAIERLENTSGKFGSQEAVVRKLENLNVDLTNFWKGQNRVEALKIAIKVLSF